MRTCLLFLLAAGCLACTYDPRYPIGTLGDARPEAGGDGGRDQAQDLGAHIGDDAGQDVADDVGQDAGQNAGEDAARDVSAAPDGTSDVARPEGPPPDMIMCGNGVREPGETCEPVAECTRQQAACVSDRRTVRTRRGNPGACTFVCDSAARACGPADGFCLPDCTGDPDCAGPGNCVNIQFCTKPTAPNQGSVVCITNENPCTANQRIGECTVDAREVCGAGHRRPVLYVPPIDGLTSG